MKTGLKPTQQQTCSGVNLDASWKAEVAQLRRAQARSGHRQGECIHFNAAAVDTIWSLCS